MDSMLFLEDSNLYNVLCPQKLKNIMKNHDFEAYKKSDYIYFEQDSANKVYLIEKGKVKLGYYSEEGQEVIKAILTQGELFGEKAILGQHKRTEFAQSMDNTTSICPIEVDTMLHMMKENQNFSLSIYKFIGLRLGRLERRLKLLLYKDVKKRLLEFLDELKEDYGYCCPKTGDTIIKHPYTQMDIANLIGTSRPTLNILMNELKVSNVIAFNRKEIRLKNVA